MSAQSAESDKHMISDANFPRADTPVEALTQVHVRALRDSEERFGATFEQAAVGLAHIAPDGRFQRVNQKFCDMVGHGRAELVGQPLRGITHPDDLALNQSLMDQMLKGQRETFSTDTRYMHKRGTRAIWARLTMSLVRDRDRQPRYFIAVAEDITIQRRAEHELQSLGRQHELILNSVAEGIIGISRAGRVTFANKAATRMLHWPVEDLVGNSYQRFTCTPNPRHTLCSVCPVQRALHRGERSQDLDALFHRQDHRPLPVLYSVAPAYDEQGRTVGAVLTFEDTTAKKQAEHEMHRLNLQLKQKNAELEQFVHTASHDLKSPLVTIQGFVSHLKKDIVEHREDRLAAFLDRIETAAGDMRDRVDHLLRLSRAGRVVGQQEPVSIEQLTQEWVDRHTETIEQHNADIHIASGMPRVRVDRVRFVEVIDNLLSNAMKYAGDAPRIDVGCVKTQHECRFYVRDNGPGIPAESTERVFGLFQRAHTDIPGCGVGLAIVKRITESHNGRVWVESIAGKGCTFWFALPNSACIPSEPEHE